MTDKNHPAKRQQKNTATRRTDDQLWKSILETVFSDFLLFFYPDAEKIFDFSKGFVYLDKELDALFPPEANTKGVRFVDKLVKVSLRGGGEKYILVHIEVQSQKGKGDLAERMFTYFYRVKDKYGLPITAIAILADGSRSYHPSAYVEEFLDTRLRYEFAAYKIIDQDEAMLRTNPNPFAVCVLTCLLTIKHKNMDDEQLKEAKHELYPQMVNREMTKEKRRGIYDFLTYFVRFQDTEMFRIFEKELLKNEEKDTTMGTEEYLLDKARKEGKTEGRAEGRKEERTKMVKLLQEERAKAEAEKLTEKRESARKMLRSGFEIPIISDIIGLPIEEIEKLK